MWLQKNKGVTSPPLKPAPRVNPVNKILVVKVIIFRVRKGFDNNRDS
jgi:hypothetical protein